MCVCVCDLIHLLKDGLWDLPVEISIESSQSDEVAVEQRWRGESSAHRQCCYLIQEKKPTFRNVPAMLNSLYQDNWTMRLARRWPCVILVPKRRVSAQSSCKVQYPNHFSKAEESIRFISFVGGCILLRLPSFTSKRFAHWPIWYNPAFSFISFFKKRNKFDDWRHVVCQLLILRQSNGSAHSFGRTSKTFDSKNVYLDVW